MAAFSALVEIKVVSPVKFVDSVEDIFTRVRVDDIEKNGYS